MEIDRVELKIVDVYDRFFQDILHYLENHFGKKFFYAPCRVCAALDFGGNFNL